VGKKIYAQWNYWILWFDGTFDLLSQNAPNMEIKKKRENKGVHVNPSSSQNKRFHTLMEVGVWQKKKKFKPKHL